MAVPVFPVGTPVDVADHSHFSGPSEIKFAFASPVSKIYIVGHQVAGDPVSSNYALHQALMSAAPTGNSPGESLILNDASGSTNDLETLSVYSTNLLYKGRGVFGLVLNFGANGNAYFDLTILGIA